MKIFSFANIAVLVADSSAEAHAALAEVHASAHDVIYQGNTQKQFLDMIARCLDSYFDSLVPDHFNRWRYPEGYPVDPPPIFELVSEPGQDAICPLKPASTRPVVT